MHTAATSPKPKPSDDKLNALGQRSIAHLPVLQTLLCYVCLNGTTTTATFSISTTFCTASALQKDNSLEMLFRSVHVWDEYSPQHSQNAFAVNIM